MLILEWNLVFHDKSWALYVGYKTSVKHLRLWKIGKRNSLKFDVPVISLESQNHHDGCYFYAFDLVGLKNLPSLALQAWNLSYYLWISLMTLQSQYLKNLYKVAPRHLSIMKKHQIHLKWIKMKTFLRFLINYSYLIKRSWMTW